MPVPFPAGVDHRLMADRLMRLTAAAPFPAFRWKRGVLHAGEAVGCVQVGRLRINILPKLDSDELDRDKLFLLNLLRSTGYLSYLHPESAEVRATFLDPLEVMISEAIAEIAATWREGAPDGMRRSAKTCIDCGGVLISPNCLRARLARWLFRYVIPRSEWTTDSPRQSRALPYTCIG